MTATALVIATAGSAFAAEASRLAAAATAVRDIRTQVPQEYWSRARCVLVIPELKKAAFIFGGDYGKGVMSCRAGEQWSAPVFMQIAKGSWGFQAGVEQADLVLLVMNQSGVQKLLRNRVNLGADASVGAGPLGQRASAATDSLASVEILSYSRSKGLFAGVDLSGGVLRPDEEANTSVYGAGAAPSTILATREMSAPPEAAPFLAALKVTSPTDAARSSAPSATTVVPRQRGAAPGGDDIRARVVDIQQALDRLLADASAPAAGISGLPAGKEEKASVSVDRARLMQLRQQLDALLAALNKR